MIHISCNICQHQFDAPISKAGELNFQKCKSMFTMNLSIKVPCQKCKTILTLQKTGEDSALGIKSNDLDQLNSQEKTHVAIIEDNANVKIHPPPHMQQKDISVSLKDEQALQDKPKTKSIKINLNLDQDGQNSTHQSNDFEIISEKTKIKPFKILPQFMQKDKDFKLELKENTSKTSKFNGNTLLISAAGLCIITLSFFIFSLLKEKPLHVNKESIKNSRLGKYEKIAKQKIKKSDDMGSAPSIHDSENTDDETIPYEEDAYMAEATQEETYPNAESNDLKESSVQQDVLEEQSNKFQGGVSEELNINQETASYETLDLNVKRYQKKLLDLPKLDLMTSSYGVRLDPFTSKLAFHSGLDFRGAIGTPVRAALSGKVKYAAKKGRYGNVLIIKHESGFESRYAHLSKFLVKKGDEVKKSDIVAHVGNTGRSTGPHLHFELLKNGKKINPLTVKFAQKK